MSHLENILENNLEILNNLVKASKLHTRTINLLNHEIDTLKTKNEKLTAQVKKLEEEKADKKEVFRFHIIEEL